AGYRFGKLPGPDYFEALVDALQQAYAARLEGLGDIRPGSDDGCTTHITAIDREGGIAALTTTLLSSFGSRYVLPQTGILMNNGIMWFDPRPGRRRSRSPARKSEPRGGLPPGACRLAELAAAAPPPSATGGWRPAAAGRGCRGCRPRAG